MRFAAHRIALLVAFDGQKDEENLELENLQVFLSPTEHLELPSTQRMNNLERVFFRLQKGFQKEKGSL